METVPVDDNARGFEIRATKLRRFLTIATFETLIKFRRFRMGEIVFCPFGICIKGIERGRLVEANTMEFIRQHTSVPVPQVYCAFRTKKRLYIVMQRIEGEMLCLNWQERSAESQAKVFAQLKKMVEELRTIPAPTTGGPRNLLGGPLFDIRVHTQRDIRWEFGPYQTLQDFHRHLRAGKDARRVRGLSPQVEANLNKLMDMHENRSWPLRLTHADLSAYNVLVRGDEVVGIVDWETAGWYPSYYEYTQAAIMLHFGGPGNRVMLLNTDKFLEPFCEEHEMEFIRIQTYAPMFFAI